MASTLSCVLGAFTLIIGIWGMFDSPVLVLFDAVPGMAYLWLVTGAVTLILAVWGLAVLPLWMRIVGVLFITLAAAGFSITAPLGPLLPDTTPDNLLLLALGLGFSWAGFVQRPPPKWEPPPLNPDG